MLSFINRLVREFEQEHGIHPNLLYLNRFHFENLKASFDSEYTTPQILDLLEMEVIIENDITHPHVAWTQIAKRAASV